MRTWLDSAFVSLLPAKFGEVFRHVLERGFVLRRNRTNPSLHRLLHGALIPASTPGASIVVRGCAEPSTTLPAHDWSLLWSRVT